MKVAMQKLARTKRKREDAIVDGDGWGTRRRVSRRHLWGSRGALGLGVAGVWGRGRGAAALGHTHAALRVATGASSDPATPQKAPASNSTPS